MCGARRKQISQDRRFFYAQYAEGVAYHQESIEQAARNHAQAYAQSVAAYWQAEQFHRRDFQLARLQHKRDMEVTLEAEVRDGLRDEFAIKNNRFNTVLYSPHHDRLHRRASPPSIMPLAGRRAAALPTASV